MDVNLAIIETQIIISNLSLDNPTPIFFYSADPYGQRYPIIESIFLDSLIGNHKGIIGQMVKNGNVDPYRIDRQDQII